MESQCSGPCIECGLATPLVSTEHQVFTCEACHQTGPHAVTRDDWHRLEHATLFARLQAILSLGTKRLLEVDQLRPMTDLTDDLLETLLLLAHPLCERDEHQFRALLAWREMGHAYKRVVDRILAAMRQLPRELRNQADTALLGLVPHLRSLRLVGNYESDKYPHLTPNALAGLTRLDTLRLPQLYMYDTHGEPVHIQGSIPELIRAAPTSLTRLELTWGDAEGDADAWYPDGPFAPVPPLGHLSLLTDLSLRNNMERYDPQHLGGLSRLTRLSVNRNFTGPLPAEVCASLTALRLNFVDGFDTRAFQHLTALRELKVHHDDAQDELVEMVSVLTSLERLVLPNATDEALVPLTRLTALDLSYTEVSDATLYRLSYQLRELKLGDWNRVTDAALGTLQYLHTLYLESGYRGNVEVSLLVPLAASLTKLDLRRYRTDLRAQVGQLTRLRKLRMPFLVDEPKWEFETLAPLKELESFEMGGASNFWSYQLSTLPRLTHLRQSRGYVFDAARLSRLSGLSRIELSYGAGQWNSQREGILAMRGLRRLKLNNVQAESYESVRAALDELPSSCYVTIRV